MRYRPEIDGLRSIAVLPVILFHAGVSQFSGGFIGVDVFFVISGFLITGIITEDIARERFSLWDFYERRARRILPALLFVLLCSTGFAWAWMLPTDFLEFAQATIATCLFYSNIFFWQTSGYFDVEAEFKPLLHTWSLSVEEQFYLLFPISLLIAWRFGRKSVIWALVAALFASLAVSEWGWRTYPGANFFLLPTRAWELLAGSLCWFAVLRPGAAIKQLLSGLGLAFIVGSLFMFNSRTPVPSLYAAVPVIGTMLVLLFAQGGTWVARILSTRPLVYIGLISYSAYLWHQPLFALSRIRFDDAEEPAFVAGLIALTFVLAWLTYTFIELPFRRRGPAAPVPLRRLTAAAVSSSTLLILFASFGIAEINNGRFRLKEIVLNKTMIDMTDERLRSWQSFISNPSYQKQLAAFSTEEGGTRRILIVGDSHAKDLFNAVFQNASKFDDIQFRVAFFNNGCMAPGKILGAASRTRTCLEQFTKKYSQLMEGATHVMLSMRWVNFDAPVLQKTLGAAIEEFEKRGKEVIVASNSPEYQPAGPIIISRLFREGTLTKAAADRAFYERLRNRVSNTNALVEQIAHTSGAIFLNKLDYICSGLQKTCEAITPDGFAIYADNSHYTVEGARYLGAIIAHTGWIERVRNLP